MNPTKIHTQPTSIMDFDHESVLDFAHENAGKSDNQIEQAVSLYYAVRDGIRYNPYKFFLTIDGLKASNTLAEGEAWCVPKAALLAACCRAMGMPTRLGYADVRNHLSTARMRERMQTNIFQWHGYTSHYLNGKWVKSTPAFNVELCEKFRLRVLDFNGQEDSIYHPFDLEGNKHMDYVRFRGEFDDVPLELMLKTFGERRKDKMDLGDDADFDADVDREMASESK